jgi:hypothetical protein
LIDQLGKFVDRRWRLLILITWLLYSVWLIYARWNFINAFVLTDTDDNMRISQVRALLAGQDWFDLRQYKMNWPAGANIHWSRLVDLPIAGLILFGRTFMTGPHAEQMAVGVAPLIPLLLLLVSLALSVRRLVAPAAWPLAVACLFFAWFDHGHVPADADRSSQLAAGPPGPWDDRHRRPAPGARAAQRWASPRPCRCRSGWRCSSISRSAGRPWCCSGSATRTKSAGWRPMP